MASRAEYQREWKLKNPDKVKAARHRQRTKTPEHTRPSAKKWARENYLNKRKGYNLKRKYGITREQYDTMFQNQRGLCASCNGLEPAFRNGNRSELAVDHDHATGKVRKLLCSKCNVALGMLDEDPNKMLQLISYIESFKKEG